jgi:hypothetical protein
MSGFPLPVEIETLARLELILCHRQPGKLRISKRACALRYLEAQKTGCKPFVRGFNMVRKWGLERCRTCPEGLHYAEEILATPFGQEHGRQ